MSYSLTSRSNSTCAATLLFFVLLCTISSSTAEETNVTAFSVKNDYGKVLGLSLNFYEAQRSGALPSSNSISWRGDSFLNDCDGVMSGGYFDAGDHLKLLFPLSTSLAFIGLATADFSNALSSSGQLQSAQDALRWGADILMAAHIAPSKFIGQVGDPGPDHAYWGRPEDYSTDKNGARPCYTWDMSSSQPASDLASAAASALAAAAIVFKSSDTKYAQNALSHAKQLYDVATANEGRYSSSYASATYVYNSNSYRDDLALAAAMLWKATGDGTYLDQLKSQRSKSDFNKVSFVNWDDVGVLSAVLMKCGGEATSESTSHLDQFLADWENCNGNGFQKSPLGLCIPSLGGWGNLRHATSAAFAALLYANCESDAGKRAAAIQFAKSQVDYALGSSGRSYVVGYGQNPPLRAHHRAASCPDRPATCDWNAFTQSGPNPQIINGALVGGPAGPGDSYKDDRSDYVQNEVAIDFNAGFTGALAGLVALY